MKLNMINKMDCGSNKWTFWHLQESGNPEPFLGLLPSEGVLGLTKDWHFPDNFKVFFHFWHISIFYTYNGSVLFDCNSTFVYVNLVESEYLYIMWMPFFHLVIYN